MSFANNDHDNDGDDEEEARDDANTDRYDDLMT